MAELVDALVSGTSIDRCGGSSPLLGTNDWFIKRTVTEFQAVRFFSCTKSVYLKTLASPCCGRYCPTKTVVGLNSLVRFILIKDELA